jgi:hypothetical protein
MAKYKLSGNGVKDNETGACIPNSNANRHWKEYQEWVAEGNTPDPEFTQEELDSMEIQGEIQDLRFDMKKADVWLFRMLLEMFEVGKAKGLWDNADFSTEIKQRAADWKVKLDRLLQLGDN